MRDHLIGESDPGRLLDDSAKALYAITDTDYGADAEVWRKWWDRVGAGWVMPSDAQVEKARRARAKVKQRYAPGAKTSNYHGITTPSRRVLFVVDVSGSMEDLVVDRERFAGRGYRSFQKLAIVKEELKRTIEGLESWVEFDVLAFATEVDPWKKGLVRANVLQKRSAQAWIEKLKPIGGSSTRALSDAGLRSAAGRSAGRTNTFAALMSCLGVRAQGSRIVLEPGTVDTVFFLSDGEPSVGQFVDEGEIREKVIEANRRARLVIHTLAIGQFSKNFMESLAAENGGVFVDLGG